MSCAKGNVWCLAPCATFFASSQNSGATRSQVVSCCQRAFQCCHLRIAAGQCSAGLRHVGCGWSRSLEALQNKQQHHEGSTSTTRFCHKLIQYDQHAWAQSCYRKSLVSAFGQLCALVSLLILLWHWLPTTDSFRFIPCLAVAISPLLTHAVS
jgi:hypothetical protein